MDVEKNAQGKVSIETDVFDNELLKYFNDISRNSENDCYIAKDFESEKLKSNSSVERAIKKANAKCQIDDAKSKLGFRKTVSDWLFTILLLQIIFMNLVIGWLVVSQTSSFAIFHVLQNEELVELSTLTKWYTSATVLELVSIFIYIIRVVFAKPNIN